MDEQRPLSERDFGAVAVAWARGTASDGRAQRLDEEETAAAERLFGELVAELPGPLRAVFEAAAADGVVEACRVPNGAGGWPLGDGFAVFAIESDAAHLYGAGDGSAVVVDRGGNAYRFRERSLVRVEPALLGPLGAD